MVIQIPTNVIPSSSLVALLVPGTVHRKCSLSNHIHNSQERFITGILLVKDTLVLAHTNLLPIHNNMRNQHHMGSLHSQWEAPCLVNH